MVSQRANLLRIGLTYIGFISLGLPDGLLGVAWPSIRAFFLVPLDALGPFLGCFTLGYLLSSFSSGCVLSHLNVGRLLALSCLATASSLLGYALAPQWGLMVALASLSGLGAGAIDAGLNTYAALHFRPRVVSWLHACYGVGATSGPIIMSSVLSTGLPWQVGYGIVGLGQLALAGGFGLTSHLWGVAAPVAASAASPPTASTSGWSTLRLPGVWLSIVVFFVYTGVEAAAGAWIYSLLTEARGMSAMSAGVWVSLYWGSLTAGRLASGVVLGWVTVPQLLRFCIMGMALGAALIWLHLSQMSSCLGLVMMGLGAAPIFPTLIATTPARLGEVHAANSIGFQIAAAVLGQSLLPGTLGILARVLGLEIISPMLLLSVLVLLGLYEALMARPSPMVQESPHLT